MNLDRCRSRCARPIIEFYEGAKGIDAIHQNVLSSAKRIVAYGSYAIVNKAVKYQALDFRKKRIALKIPLTAVTDSSAVTIEMLKQPAYRRLTALFLDDTLSSMPAWIVKIYLANQWSFQATARCEIMQKGSSYCMMRSLPQKMLR